jgi:hypothetical protein
LLVALAVVVELAAAVLELAVLEVELEEPEHPAVASRPAAAAAVPSKVALTLAEKIHRTICMLPQ